MTGRIVALLLVIALAGCGRPGAALGSASGSPSATAPVAASAVPGVLPTTGDLVEYGRQGGIAGIDERLTIRADGSYEIAGRGGAPVQGRLSPAELAGLRQVLDRSRFDRIPSVNPAPPGSADTFTYFVGYGSHGVLAPDGAVPQELKPVLNALEAIASR